jgi:hypothetical protein
MGPAGDAAGVVAMRVNGTPFTAAVLAAAAAAMVTGAAARPARADDARRSLVLETPAEAWRRSGFRVTLAVPYGEIVGLRGAPSSTVIGALLRGGLRLDAEWSLLASLQYTVARPSTALALGGVRFSGTLDPTWHLSPNFALAVGLGFGGIVETGRDRMEPEPSGDTLETSYTFPDARRPIGSCSGLGVAGVVRAEWTHTLGAKLAAAVSFELVGQWTGCVDDVGRVEPDTGEAIVRRQWWGHTGGVVALGVTFR